MTTNHNNYFVITGGPGAGETSLIAELGLRGHASVEEAGRAIIHQQRAIGRTALHTANRVLFRELMLAHMIDHYERAGVLDDPVFFDRDLPGLIGYCRLIGVPVELSSQISPIVTPGSTPRDAAKSTVIKDGNPPLVILEP